MSALAFNRETFGFGYEGLRTAVRDITKDLGNHNAHVREAVSKDFSKALTQAIKSRRGEDDLLFSFHDWTTAQDDDFDTAVFVTVRQFSRPAPQKPLIATTVFREPDETMRFAGSRLELYDDAVYLVGSTYRMTMALLGSNRAVYDSRKRDHVDKWTPFITDSGEEVAKAMYRRYERPSDNKSVNALSEAAGHAAMRRLVERYFKVSFTNVDPEVEKAA